MLIQWAGPIQFVYPLTVDQLREYAKESTIDNGTRKIFKAVAENGETIGHLEFGAIHREQKTAVLCRVLVVPDARGRGLCTPMIRKGLSIGFRELQLRRIELRVYGFNTTAIRCYEKAGFVREGLLRQTVMVEQECWDTVVMAILREEWEHISVKNVDPC